MENGIIIMLQIIKMFIILAVGYLLYKKTIINDDTTSRLSMILLNIATPCTLLVSFTQVYTPEKFQGLLIAFGLSIVCFLICIMIGMLFYGKKHSIENLSVVFSNASFMGIPLVTSLLGIEAVFYLSPFIAVFYLAMWTYAVYLMTLEKKKISLSALIMNPSILATLLGIILFRFQIILPSPVNGALSTLGSMNTPLAMIILGAYLAKTKILEMFTNIKAYLVSLMRLLVAPFIILLFLKLVPAQYNEIKLIMLIASAAPVGVTVAIFAQLYNKDYGLAAQIVSLSTLLSVVTMPLILVLSQLLW